MGAKTVRVAAVQFAVGADVEKNLETCLTWIDKAAETGAKLIVLPEFCNHLSWYDDKAHCHRVSVDVSGPFLSAIAERARRHQTFVVVNCTLRRDDGRATGTSLLYSPAGELLGTSDKQVLMGHENDYLERATEASKVIDTPIGRLGLYACMDGVIMETPRCLALSGAQILCNSLNSFAPDEASLHIPVRAPENRVFVVAANKVGPLIPEFLLDPVSQATSIPKEFLFGAGESQIVAPDGRVLAKASRTEPGVVFADIDVEEADKKARPDGTDVFASRRPELYAPIASSAAAVVSGAPAEKVVAAVVQPSRDGAAALADAVASVVEAARRGAELIVLPELVSFEGARIGGSVADAIAQSHEVLRALQVACGDAHRATGVDCVVVTSVVQGGAGGASESRVASGAEHVGVVVGREGVRHRQAQLHRNARHPWARLGSGVSVATLPWGKLGVVVGDDALYPETFRLLALAGAEVVAVPTHVVERWEVETGLVERAAENRLCLAAATRVTASGESLLATLWKDFTLMTAWESRPFDGQITFPRLTRAERTPGITVAELSPAVTHNKTVSHRTHLVDGRPFALASAITRPQ